MLLYEYYWKISFENGTQLINISKLKLNFTSKRGRVKIN